MRKIKMMAALAAMILLLAACAQKPAEQTDPSASVMPTQFGGRSSWDYSWEEFEAMSPADQMGFQQSFDSLEDFDRWRLSVQAAFVDIPWENGGKQPAEYTMDEFEALDETLQVLFENSFASTADFEAWMLAAQYAKIGTPWVDAGKAPADYTWEEFEALTPEQQILFQNSFESLADFDIWLQSAQSQQTAPTVDLGDKSIWDFTWTDFENMSGEEQMAFQYTFESPEDFDRWLQEAQGNTGSSGELPWERDGRRPEDYTWAEFEALSPEHQIIFQSSFATEDGFEQWLMANLPQ